jgi:hypothetical protein
MNADLSTASTQPTKAKAAQGGYDIGYKAGVAAAVAAGDAKAARLRELQIQWYEAIDREADKVYRDKYLDAMNRGNALMHDLLSVLSQATGKTPVPEGSESNAQTT